MCTLGFFALGLGAFALIAILIIATSIFWIWMLIDCLMNPALDSIEKLIWILVIFFLHLLGAILYFAIGRRRPIG